MDRYNMKKLQTVRLKYNKAMASSDLVIGIDLGTTNSCASVFRHKSVKILENKEGGRITPSCVFFTETGAPIVGQYARRMSAAKPEYGITEVKRLVGRKYDDPSVKENLKYLPFTIKNINNEPVVVIESKNKIIKKTPEELCSIILKKIKIDVEDKLGLKIDKAVITVPAYFNVTQREATLAAANKAGFTVLKLLNEPTAAALSYYHEHNCKQDYFYSLVYDLGGGTFDVAILLKKENDIKVIAVDGDTHLGGHDLDNLIIDYVCDLLQNDYKYDPKVDRRNIRRLANECEEAKKILSVVENTEIILTGFVPNLSSIEIPITRTKFEEMAQSFLNKTIEIMERCLSNSNLQKTDIKEVILCGGSTRIPKVAELVQKFFDGRALNRFLNPDECVAEGAALQAAMLSQDELQEIDEFKITDVAPLSLGISSFVDVMTFLIKKNTPLPASGTSSRITVHNRQVTMALDIFEGERLNSKKNHFLGKLELTDLTPAPPGQCVVTVKMILDQNGILTVEATEVVSEKTKVLKVAYTRGHRSDSEINKCLSDAAENQEEDKTFESYAEERGFVIQYCIRAMFNFERLKIVDEFKEIYGRCKEIKERLQKLDKEDVELVAACKDEILKNVKPIAKRHNFINMV